MRISPPSCARAMPGLRRAVLALCLCVLAACQVELNSNLDEQEANEMMAKLLANGIAVSKVIEKDTITLMVKREQFGEAVDLLKQHGLPRKKFSSTGDLFKGDNLVASPMQEWARFTYAKSQELSQSISSIPGVIKADVHIANQRKESPFDEVKPPSASVLIQMTEDRMTSDLVPQIKQLVSYSIPDIDYDRVGVVITPVAAPPETGQKMVNILGMIVHRDSATIVKVLIGAAVGGVVAALGLGGALLHHLRRRRTVPNGVIGAAGS